MRLDHISYAAGPDGLASCVQRLGATLGAGFLDGGLHPGFGTRNFVLPLRNGIYLEVVAALDHPAVDTAAFGRVVRARTEAGGGWLGWAIQVEDIAPFEARIGRSAADGHRRRPDGVDLRWRQLGVLDLALDPQLPYFLQWLTGGQDHPSQGGDAIELTGLEIAGDAKVVDDYLGVTSDQPLDGVSVDWLGTDDGDTGVVAAIFQTPMGSFGWTEYSGRQV